MSAVSEQAARQLGVLQQLDTALSSAQIRFWLRGGWAIDFLLGRITRPHADLDMVIWERQRNRASDRLLRAGFQAMRETNAQIDFRRDDQEMSFVFVERNHRGSIVAHGIPDWIWQPDALPLRKRTLHDVSARIVSPQQLLDEKEGYARGTGRPLRPEDIDSIRVIRRLIAASKER